MWNLINASQWYGIWILCVYMSVGTGESWGTVVVYWATGQ